MNVTAIKFPSLSERESDGGDGYRGDKSSIGKIAGLPVLSHRSFNSALSIARLFQSRSSTDDPRTSNGGEEKLPSNRKKP